MTVPRKETVAETPKTVKAEETQIRKPQIAIPQKPEQKEDVQKTTEKEDIVKKEEKKEKTYIEQKAYKDKTYIPKEKTDKPYTPRDSRPDKGGYHQRDSRTDRPYTPKPADKKPGFARTDSHDGRTKPTVRKPVDRDSGDDSAARIENREL